MMAIAYNKLSEINNLLDPLVGSLCSSPALLVCCPGLDLPGSRHPHLQSMADKAVFQGQRACAALATLLRGHSLLHVSCLCPFSMDSICSGSCQRRTYFPGLQRLLGQ